jgi:hypothetical protein
MQFSPADMTRYASIESRSASFENPKGEKGRGGAASSWMGPGRKGFPCKPLDAGEEVVMAEIDGPGMVRHIWMTTFLDPHTLRGAVIRMYWDGSARPAVECPIGDFFGIAHGRTNHFANVLQAMQDSTGLNCYFQMPFAQGARVTVTNEQDARMGSLYYSVDYTIGDEIDADTLRFHSSFRRENPTQMTQDFAILPKRQGRGRFLGCVIGVRTRSPQWWGEGEFKVYLDGDDELPTICGTGTEDYLGAAWGTGEHFAPYAGTPYIAYDADQRWQKLVSFYRFHVMDPIFFAKDIRVEMQQIGGGWLPDGQVNIYERADDWSAAAFWYQDPGEELSPLPKYSDRIADLDLLPYEKKYDRVKVC